MLERGVKRECPCVAGESEFFRQRFDRNARGISEVKLSHTVGATSAVFDDPNLVRSAGLVPVMRLAAEAGPADLRTRC